MAFKPSKSSFSAYQKLTEHVLDNMEAKGERKQFAGILLAGEPGVGKTTYINFLSKLLGIEAITIEAPHIVEEHIINIPFIVFKPDTGKTVGGVTREKEGPSKEGAAYSVVLADSNLFSQISQARLQPDAEYLKKIYSSSGDVVALFEAFGGNKDTVPEDIHRARANYSVILFLDEYFRQNSPRIRNILRGILNGKIGRHDIPKHVFIIYASNMHDEGGSVEEQQTNMQFDRINMKVPDTEQWFSWIYYKFEKDEHVKLKPELLNKFHKLFTKAGNESHLSFKDVDADVRTSPRRWEQLFLYINAALPCKDEKDAKNLITNVKTNFRNYLEPDQSKSFSTIAADVLEAVTELIKETSNIEISPSSVNARHGWRETLKHQIEMKMKLGEHRKYVPVVAGLPGIGKTTHAEIVAHDLNLAFIDLDVSQLNPEDVIGLPLPKTDENDKMHISTSFSEPGLYKLIMNKIHEEDSKKISELESEENGAEKVKEYKKARWKYLIFFDELNRNNTKVFNAIRRVLLEKNFGPSDEHGGKLLELPKEAIMMAAINPYDTGASVQELTHHMRDVLDVIDSGSSWEDTVAYLKNQKVKRVDQHIHDLFLYVMQLFVNRFKTGDKQVPIEERPFHLDLGQDVYISPREYTQLFINGSMKLQRKMNEIEGLDLENMTPKQVKELEKRVRGALWDAFEMTLENPFDKHGVDWLEFGDTLKQWLMTSNDIDIGEGLFYKKAKGIARTLKTVIAEHLEGTAATSAADNQDFVNYILDNDVTKFREGLTELLQEKLKDKKSIDYYLLDETQPKLTLKGKKVAKDGSEKVTRLNNFMLDIIYALHLHKVSNEKIDVIYNGVNAAVKTFLKSSLAEMGTDTINEIRHKIGTMLAETDDVIDDLAASKK